MAAWIATSVLALLAAFCVWATWSTPDALSYVTVILFALASLLLFPPLWRKQKTRGLRLARIAAAVVMTVAGFTMPIKTHAVIYLPPPSQRQ